MNDKEGRKWLLQKLYDKGFKYIFHSGGFGGYIATKERPEILDNHKYVWGSFERIDVLSDLIPDFNDPNYLDIGKYLDIFDWGKVAVDTPIIVNELPSVELRRYFKEYKDGKVYYFSGGRTSWSSMSSEYITPDKVRLAGGDDEN